MKQLIIWFVSLALAFTAGYLVNQLAETSSHSGAESLDVGHNSTLENKPQPAIDNIAENQITSPNNQQNPAMTGSPAASFQDVEAQLEALSINKLEELSFSDIAQLYGLVADLPESQVLTLMRQFSIDKLEDANAIFTVLFSKYVEVNPQDALNFVSNEIENEQTKNILRVGAIAGLAKKDPLLAFEYFLQNSDAQAGIRDRNQSMLNSSLFATFYNLAKQDRSLAIDKLNELDQNGHAVNMAVMGLTRAFDAKQEFVDLLTLTESLDNYEIDDAVVREWTRKNPQQVAAWLTQDYNGARYDDIKDNFIQTWSYSDRVASADWMVANSEAEKLSKNVVDFIRTWAWDNPQAAMEWFSRQPSNIYNQGNFGEFLSDVAHSQPQFATQYLSYVDNEKTRSKVSQSIYQGLKRKSTNQAEAFLEQSPFKEDILKFDKRINR